MELIIDPNSAVYVGGRFTAHLDHIFGHAIGCMSRTQRNVASVTWRYWYTFSSFDFAMRAVRNAYAEGRQFAFRYY